MAFTPPPSNAELLDRRTGKMARVFVDWISATYQGLVDASITFTALVAAFTAHTVAPDPHPQYRSALPVGASGTFITVDLKTVTVEDGIITSIV